MRRVKNDSPLTPDEAARLFQLPGPAPEKVVLAVSGGPDSTALSGLYAEAQALAGLPPATVATVDHGLRASSQDEADAVARFSRMLGFAHKTLPWTGPKPQAGVQEAARIARYRLLAGHARDCGAGAIIVAHTLDDQAETVLMRLTRGSGPKGLGGMDTVSLSHGLRVFRPFLDVPKARLVATCHHRSWPYVVDPSNTNTNYLRARLRSLAPTLHGEGLTPERLCRLAARLRRADEALDLEALRVMEECRVWERGATRYDAARLAMAAEEIVVRIFAHNIMMARDAGDPAAPVRLDRIETLAQGFLIAMRDKAAFRRNAGGVLFTLRRGVLSVEVEPERRGKRLISSRDNAPAALGKLATDP